MDSGTFMGLFIAALVVLVGLAGTLTTLIIKPVISLNRNLTEMNTVIKQTRDECTDLKSEVNSHEHRLDEHELKLLAHEKDIETLKGGIKYGK